MDRLRKLVFIASVLALLVLTPAEVQTSDVKSKKDEELKVQEVDQVDHEHQQHPLELAKDEEASHHQEDGHHHETEDHIQEHEEDEHDTISELVSSDKPLSSHTSGEHEDADHHTDKGGEEAEHEEPEKGRLSCCLMSLPKPLSTSSSCSCSQWLKHALRQSIFLRPLLALLRNSLPLFLPPHRKEESGAHDLEEESETLSDLRQLGILGGGRGFGGGYPGYGYGGGYPGYGGGYPGYGGGYPGYGGGYPGYYGYPGGVWGGEPGLGMGVSI